MHDQISKVHDDSGFNSPNMIFRTVGHKRIDVAYSDPRPQL
jgi:hypothetical protein